MLRGRFGNTTGRPYIAGRLVLPRLHIHSDISFLIDTGSDTTGLLVDDAAKMRVDYKRLRRGKEDSIGIGGTMRPYLERAIVTFEEAGKRLYIYEIELWIAPYNRKLRRIPSILGRDILDRWHMSYYPARDRLSIRVVSADYTVHVA